MKWFRSHHGAPFDSKISVVAKRANVTRGHAASVWWAVLDYASQQNERGSVAGIDPEEIAAAFDYEEEDVARVLDAMRHKATLIDDSERLTGWDKRQVQREDESAAERKRKQRSREQDDASRDVTQGHAPDKSREDTEEKIPIPSELSADGASNEPEDLKSKLFGSCLDWLAKRTGKPADKFRPQMGKWCRDYGDDTVLRIMRQAAREPPVEPVAWIEKALAQENRRQGPSDEEIEQKVLGNA